MFWKRNKKKLPPVTEQELIALAQRDIRAFAPLYEKYFDPIFRFVYRRLESKDDAADVTQIIFLKAMQFLPKYKDYGHPFSSWLYRIALNELNLLFRAQKAQHTIHASTEQLESLLHEAGEHTLAQERMEKLLQILPNLEAEEIYLLEMRFFDQKSFQEVGEILQITENNAKVKTYRLLDAIRKKML